MVVRLFAVSAEDLVTIVVAVVARTPVRSRTVVVLRSLLLLTVVVAEVTAGIGRFSVPIGTLSLRAELYSLDLRLVLLDRGDSFGGIPDLGLITGQLKCPGISSWSLLRHAGSQLPG